MLAAIYPTMYIYLYIFQFGKKGGMFERLLAHCFYMQID